MWAIGLAVAASRTLNPVLLVLLAVVVWFVVQLRSDDAPWARAFAMFVRIALLVVGLRVLLQAVLTTYSQGSHVILTLPRIPLPQAVQGIKLGGVVTWEALHAALCSGGQLAVMLLCIGAANALASPVRLLKLLPGALYELQVACVVALTLVPQLVTDARRIRDARRLRGQTVRQRNVFRTTMMPVLEGALDRCVELAAAMESRGFGRTHQLSSANRLLGTTTAVLGACGIAVGIFGFLAASMPVWASMLVLLAGVAMLVTALLLGRDRAVRSSYRPDLWALPEWGVAACGVAVAAVFVALSALAPGSLGAGDPLQLPVVSSPAVAGILLGLVPAALAPRPLGRTSSVAWGARP